MSRLSFSTLILGASLILIGIAALRSSPMAPALPMGALADVASPAIASPMAPPASTPSPATASAVPHDCPCAGECGMAEQSRHADE